MKIDPRHLEILAAIISEGGLVEGANHLGKSQPSVSRSLSLLEQRVGAPLFEKGRRPLRPTELCLDLAKEGRAILEAGDSASTIVASYFSGKQGLVRLAGPPIFMDGVINPLLAIFQVQYPDVRIEQGYDYIEEALRRTRIGALDVVIGPLRRDALPEDFEFEELLPGRNVIACGSLHPLLRRGTIRLADIADYPWIAPPTESPLYQDLRTTLASIGIHDFRVSFSGGSLASITNILAQTDALTVLPHSVVVTIQNQKAVRALPIRIDHPERSLGVLRPIKAPSRPSVARLIRFLRAECSQLLSTISAKEKNQLWRG